MTHTTTVNPDGDTGADRAQWTSAYINDLPDSSFLYIAPGGSKDPDGKTTPRSLRYFPVKDSNGNIDLPHVRNALSRIPQANLSQSIKDTAMAKARRMLGTQTNGANPDGDILRYQDATPDLFEIRDLEDGGMPTLAGHFAVFNQWAEINSLAEGRFLERIAPGAFTKTIAENQRNMRVLFNHGKHQQIGELVLGPIQTLREDTAGAYYEVPLYDTSYNRDLIPGLRDNQYGSSFRFRMLNEDVVRSPEPSDHNPDGLPERTITEAKVLEFGPVTFPAYPGATAGLRSATDWWLEQNLMAALQALTGRAAALEADPPREETVPPVTLSRRTRRTSKTYLGKERRSWQLP